MEIIIIAAMAENRIIGKNNALPWHIPEELQLFKKTTMGYPLIMGRKTFESFRAPLPGRRHIILSRNPSYQPKGGECAPSLDAAVTLCHQYEKVFIIGGAQVFSQAITVATSILLTHIHREFEGDVFFPPFSEDVFEPIAEKAYPGASQPFTVVTYRRRAEK